MRARKLETHAFGFISKSGLQFLVFKLAADRQTCIRRFQPTPRRPAIICGFLCFRNLNRSRSSSLRNATVIFWLVERRRFANRFVRLSLPQICKFVLKFEDSGATAHPVLWRFGAAACAPGNLKHARSVSFQNKVYNSWFSNRQPIGKLVLNDSNQRHDALQLFAASCVSEA